MIRSPLIFYLLCAAAAGLSIVRYARESIPAPWRVLLITIRAAALLLILAAFIEPTLVFERFASNDTTVPVLIDCSRSMNIVTTDTSIAASIGKLQRYCAAGKKRIKFAWYGFGDSLRRLKPPLAFHFDDRRSYFPASLDDNILRAAREVILISDGNWSNASLSRDFFYEKNVFFLPLPGVHPRPSVYLTTANTNIVTVSADSATRIDIELGGLLGKPGRVALTVYESGQVLSRREVDVDSGYFRDTISIGVPAGNPGRHLYRIEARSSLDTVETTRYVIRQTIPGKYLYRVYQPVPTLDGRYLALALASHAEFTRAARPAQKYDMAFILGTSAMDSVLARVNENGVVMFWGCLPGESEEIDPPQGLTYRVPRLDETEELSGFEWPALPPPSKILIGKNARIVGRVLVDGAELNCGDPCDSLPLLFSGRYDGRSSLFCAARDIWRWDFWPLSLGRNKEQPFAFSERIISLAKDMFLANISRQFFMYPAQEPNETDSLRCHLLFPESLDESSAVSVHFKLWDRGGKRTDTTISMAGGPTLRTVTVAPPLARGVYRYEATASSGSHSFTFSDSLAVNRDQTELTIPGQNTSLLGELAQPLDISDSLAVSSFLASHRNQVSGNEAVKEHFQLHRSWVVLGLILILFAAEWIIRRTRELD